MVNNLQYLTRISKHPTLHCLLHCLSVLHLIDYTDNWHCQQRAQLCRSYIDYRVVLKEEGRGTPDALYVARIEGGGKAEVVQRSAKEGCRAMFVMPYDILERLGFMSGRSLEPLTDPSTLSCAAGLAYKEGRQYQRRTEWMQAERKYREALAEYNRYTEAHMNLGAVLIKEGKAQEAVKELRIAVAISDRPSGEIFMYLGNACYYAEDLACAKKAYEDALDTYQATGEAENKTSIGPYGGLGIIYRELHQYDQAAVMFSKMETLLPLDNVNLRSNEIALAKNRGILAFYLGDMTAAEIFASGRQSSTIQSSRPDFANPHRSPRSGCPARNDSRLPALGQGDCVLVGHRNRE